MYFSTLYAQEAQAQLRLDSHLSLAAIGVPLLLAVVLLLWCFIKPNVGRMFARILAVLAIGLGIGVLTWGIVAASLGEAIRSPIGLASLISVPSEAIGWGAGCLAGGIAALVLSLVGGCKKPG